MNYKIDSTEEGKQLTSVLKAIEQAGNARFFFLDDWLDDLVLDERHSGRTLEEVLDQFFEGTQMSFILMDTRTLVVVKDPTQALRRKKILQSAIDDEKKVEQYIFGEPGRIRKSQPAIVSGRVVDTKTGEPMAFVTVHAMETRYSTSTDQFGNFSLQLPPGVYVLNFSFVDYENQLIDLAVYDDGVVEVSMDKKSVLLEEVIIQDNALTDLTTRRLGQTQLVMPDLKKAPAFMGEPDLIKQIQILPGVTTVGEAASGFNVRGGSVDQNLILYDGLPIFNSSHVFGFFSAFNPDAIRDVSFYNGGIPAEFGGRVSSVLDIKSKDGNYQNWSGKAGLGLITSNVMVEGPLTKDKTSIVASVRSTYSDWLVNSIRTDYADLRNSDVSFYDGSLKLAHLFSDQTKLSLTGYTSRDGFSLTGDSTFQWSNIQFSASLNHQFSKKLSSEFVAGTSSYGYRVLNNDYLTASELSYRITSTMLKGGFNYQQGDHQLSFGWQLVNYGFSPGSLKPTSSASNARNFSLDKQFSVENAFYITDEWPVNERLFIESGLRLPLFVSFGPASVYLYRDGAPREITSITDTLQYGVLQPTKAYVGVEPRVSVRWMINPTASVKFGYNRMYQFLHLVTNTAAVTPVDIWQPSGYYFRPQRGDQLSFGYFKDFQDKMYGASAEAYYKLMNNILDFKDGAQLILNPHLETELLQGRGYSYGIETSLSKRKGELTGSINYTWSRAFRVIDGPGATESINGGGRYPANFDQPHIANLSWKYNLSRRHYFTGNFTYHTGRPVTIPLSVFMSENTPVAYFSARNQYRIPDYHRLDLALVIEGNHKRKKWAEGTWVFSVYNVYARKNPYTIFFKTSEEGIPKPYQLSIIGTVFPSVSFNLEF